MKRTLRITTLGAQGDGIAETADGVDYIPFTLPGELVEATGNGRHLVLERIVEPSQDRIDPVCPHFAACGGCALQHMSGDAYRRWKRNKVVDALQKAGIDADVDALLECKPQTRRRAVFSGRNTAEGPVLGFNAAAAHEIISIDACPVVDPAIPAAFDPLRDLLALFGKTDNALRLAVLTTETGLDIEIGGTGPPTNVLRQSLTQLAIDRHFARISIDGEVIVEPVKPAIRFGDVALTPPPGGFLQATVAAENEMADLVCRHLVKAKRAADLFAGSGTFALRLARSSMVHAVEADKAALQALDRSFRYAGGLKTITQERRDLYRRPLTRQELKAYDGLVFDPPRAGAKDQVQAIAKSAIRWVAAVSCNPATLARDLAVLVDGGYRLIKVTPIDQFLWSPHVEAVALIEKPKRRR